MPSLNDMMDVVDLLKVRAIDVDELKCVAVRNRNSKCRKCADACIADAIAVDHNDVAIDAMACVNCGCCIAVCPDGALAALSPTADEVSARVAATADAASGMAVVACARKEATREGNAEKFAVVPCLGHLTECQLVSWAAAGHDDIVLVDGDCASCKYGAASPFVDAVVEEAAKLLEVAGSGAIVTRTSEFPPEVRGDADNLRGKDRRGILRQTGSYVKSVAGNVATKAIEDRLGKKESEPLSLRDRLHAGKSGKVPPFVPEENYRLLDDIATLRERGGDVGVTAQDCHTGEPTTSQVGGSQIDGVVSPSPLSEGQTLDTRHFGDVRIDVEKCSGCGMCVLFCPTEALKHAKYDVPEDDERVYLEFQAADCTQCLMCRDVCLRYCLEVGRRVEVEELFDFEPRLIEIAKPANRTNLLDWKLRRS